MKQKSLLTFLIATAMIGSFSACVDSEKDLRDGSFRMPNPMGEGFAAPEDMDWNMISDVKVSVDVEDQTSEYHSVVELYDANPIISTDAHLLAKGVAKKGEPFTTEIAVANVISTIYVKQIAPNKLSTVRAAEITNGVANCNFNQSAQKQSTTRSLAVTRGFVTPDKVNTSDASLFPTECPAGIKELPTDNSKITDNAQYKISSHTKSIDLGDKVNIKLYVTGDEVELSKLNLSIGSCLYILPGKKVSIDESKNNGQARSMISIGKGATFEIKKDIQLDSDFKLYNLGTLKAKNFSCTNNSLFYNAGSVEIENNLSGENGGATIQNDIEGKIKAEYIYIRGGSHIVNYGTVKVEERTELNCTDGSWENDGRWITDDMKIQGWNEYSINRCFLYIDDYLDMTEAHLIVDAGGYVYCDDLYMNNTRVDLGSKALFEVEEAEFGWQLSDRGFKGIGKEKALLVMKEAKTKTVVNAIHYSGALQVLCSKHPDAGDQWNVRWTMTNGAEWAKKGEHTVTIEETCTGIVGPKPEPEEPEEPDYPVGPEPEPETPSGPNYPIEMADNQNYTYLFEDQWPIYGDYDMNDAVLTITHRKLKTNKENKVTKFELSVDLDAVGATKLLSAALMLDEVPANAITQAVRFEGNARPTSFSLNAQNIENGQDKAVIPLFDNAHQKLGLGQNRYQPINTLSGNENNTKSVSISLSVEFNNPTLSPEAFNINKLNVFIIVGGNKNNRKEIHIAGFQPSKLAETSIFGDNDDDSSFSAKRYYLSKENLAWGIVVPTNFKWPLEYTKIQDAYSKFEKWVTSGGKEEVKWWTDFHVSKVFQTNKN